MKTNSNPIEILPFQVDPAISKETKAFLSVLNSGGGAPLESLPPDQAREVLAGAQKSVEVDYSGIEETVLEIDNLGQKVKLTIVRPVGIENNIPAFIFIHGGGWVLGDYPTHKRMVRDLVVLSGTVGVFVNYSPSPEAHFPVAIDEIYAATDWVSKNGAKIGVDGANLAIIGNSVGGNMSAVTALRAKLNNGPKLKLQILMWPVTHASFDTESYEKYGQDRFLTTPLMKWMYDNYTTDTQERESIYISPLNASTEQLQGLPATLIQVAEADILRDEGEAYGRKLDQAGVRVTTVCYNGMIHDFGLLNPLAELPQVKSLFIHAAAEIRKYLFA